MKFKSFFCTLILSFSLIVGIIAQGERQWDAAEIIHQLEKLKVVGSALYVAAHPDDENTRLISYLSNEEKVRTAYLSITRGDGGQNLIGPELGAGLGVIRTQELLAARDIDGGQQFFTRANDFGYSKTPEETLNFWDKEKVLWDMVWVIRNFKPDVIINRFDHRTPGSTHGHHTASAMLSMEAFKMAGDTSKFKDQLKYVDAWQPERLFFNTSWWFYGSKEKFEEADKSKLTSVDIGVYYPVLGFSNNEIAAMARSQHKCQGFGTNLDRGEQSEYIELLKGEWEADDKSIFPPQSTGWDRLKDGIAIGQLIDIIIDNFDPKDPAQSIPLLLQARNDISKLENDHWRNIKLKEVDELIKAVSGLYFEAVVESPTATPGEKVEISIEAIGRSPMPEELKLIQLSIKETGLDTTLDLQLAKYGNYNVDHRMYFETEIPDSIKYSTPYWLRKPWLAGMYSVPQINNRGKAENEPSLNVEITISIGDQKITYTEPVKYKKVDPAVGEIYGTFAITPPVFLNFTEEVIAFADLNPKTVQLSVESMVDSLQGSLQLKGPNGWDIQPESIDIGLNSKYTSNFFSFTIQPEKRAKNGTLEAVFTDRSGHDHTLSLTEIDYDHIPKQYVMMPAESKVVKVDMEKAGEQVAYIMGAGDAIPENLRQVGYDVQLIGEADVDLENLKRFDAVILGIRAYNTLDWLVRKQNVLFDYVEKGGTLITQYNTSYRIKTDKISPLHLKLSRERVTDESAPVEIIAPDHPVVNYPNKIKEEDFDGWVQERGLYFSDEWDEQFTPILSSHDANEPHRKGGLLVAPYGEGYFVYTGYSWFRQLPAGVPGAYRIFANMLALGNQPQ